MKASIISTNPLISYRYPSLAKGQGTPRLRNPQELTFRDVDQDIESQENGGDGGQIEYQMPSMFPKYI